MNTGNPPNKRLRFNVIQPPKAIAAFVKHFWALEGDVTKESPFVHRALAESFPEFLFYYKGFFKRIINDNEQKCFRSGIYGQKQSFDQFIVGQDFGIFGVHLYPYAISQLFQLPASELSDQSPDLKTLLGQEGEILEEKVMLASNNSERAQLLSEFLIKRLVNVKMEYPNILDTIRNTINQNYSCSIDNLARDCNLSRRQFERKFKEFSGFSPRAFLNIARFSNVIKNNINTTKSLSKIAYESGYYDQSHFIRDFRKFSGYSPKEYFKHTQCADYRATTEFKV